MSAECGPDILYHNFDKDLIAGLNIFSSSLKRSVLSQCGLSPKTAILGLIDLYFLKKLLIKLTLSKIFFL